MDRQTLERLTAELASGRISQADFIASVARNAPGTARSAELGDVTLDLDRQRRCGFPEVIFGESKSIGTLAAIFHRLIEVGQSVLATRVSEDKAAILSSQFRTARYNAAARTFRIDLTETKAVGRVAVITAGTSDIPVAEEVRETADWMGAGTDMIVDVGVAGPHRLIEKLDRITGADAVVVVAGMEAALASVVGGHVDCPVIAVPTSIGYGANLGGIAALLGMLNSCAANVSVVNIDAGFKAGYIAGMIAVRSGPSKNTAANRRTT